MQYYYKKQKLQNLVHDKFFYELKDIIYINEELFHNFQLIYITIQYY